MKTVVDNLERGWAGELVPATPSSLPWAGENGGENMLSSSLQQPSSGKPSVPPGQPRMPGIGKLHAPPPPTKESMWRKRTCRWDSGLSGVVAVGKGIDFFFKTCPDKVLLFRRNPHTLSRNPKNKG